MCLIKNFDFVVTLDGENLCRECYQKDCNSLSPEDKLIENLIECNEEEAEDENGYVCDYCGKAMVDDETGAGSENEYDDDDD